MDLEQFREIKKASRIIDIRSAEAFANGFIPGSLHLPLNLFADGLDDDFLVRDLSIVLTGNAEQEEEALSVLQNKGYEQVQGFFPEGTDQWIDTGETPDMVIRVTEEELKLDVKHDKDVRVLDIRSPEEYAIEHVKSSVNIPFKLLQEGKWRDLEQDKTWFIYDEKDRYTLPLISWLKLQGRHNFYQVTGGMESLRHSDVPIENKRSASNG